MTLLDESLAICSELGMRPSMERNPGGLGATWGLISPGLTVLGIKSGCVRAEDSLSGAR